MTFLPLLMISLKFSGLNGELLPRDQLSDKVIWVPKVTKYSHLAGMLKLQYHIYKSLLNQPTLQDDNVQVTLTKNHQKLNGLSLQRRRLIICFLHPNLLFIHANLDLGSPKTVHSFRDDGDLPGWERKKLQIQVLHLRRSHQDI